MADELLRVCRPGGTIGLTAFPPEGTAGEFFELFGRHAPPPPPGAQPPLLWGEPAHVRELFGDRLDSLELEPREYTERSPGGPSGYAEFFKRTFGPIVAVHGDLLESDPERAAAFDRDLHDFAARRNRGTDERAEYVYEYLLVTALKA